MQVHVLKACKSTAPSPRLVLKGADRDFDVFTDLSSRGGNDGLRLRLRRLMSSEDRPVHAPCWNTCCDAGMGQANGVLGCFGGFVGATLPRTFLEKKRKKRSMHDCQTSMTIVFFSTDKHYHLSICVIYFYFCLRNTESLL